MRAPENGFGAAVPSVEVSEWEVQLLSHVEDASGGFVPSARPSDVVANLVQAKEVRRDFVQGRAPRARGMAYVDDVEWGRFSR